jgi:hypothetical protein
MTADVAITLIWIGVVVAFGVAAKVCDEIECWLERRNK